MGSSNSKNSAISTKGIKRVRSRGANFFQPSCLGRSIKSSDEYHQNEQVGGSKSISFRDQNNGHSNEDVNNGHRGQVEVPQNNSTSVASLGDQAHRNASEIEFGHTSVSVQPVLSSVNQSNSCFKLIPSSISFKLGRSFSLGSSRGHPASKTHLISDVSGGLHVNRNSDADESDSHLGNSNSACTSNTMFSCHNLSCEVSSQNQNNPSKNALQSGSSEDQSSVRSVESQNSQNDYVSSFRITSRNDTQMRISEGLSRNSIWNQTELGTMETNCPHRRVGSLEPMEGTVRFSRTLSVGRLRDRVLRRTPFSEGNLQDDQVVRDVGLDNGRRFWARAARASSSYGSTNPVTSPSRNRSIIPSSVNENLDAQTDDPQSRQRSNRVLGENRATFMERRRRIRSQVRALQRLGSRFENLSEHDRSCVLTGQHRIGHCTCPTNRRGADSSDDISTRASISRIVMLAEALFEVLDEIHQRSMVLSSPPSVSSIGSLPAPKEDVECLPLKTHKKPRKYQEDAQCYICLLEYEEGDFLRILPCQHEFHQACVDKWLKEIHRVCPLCRGDICRSNSSKME